MSAFTVQHYHDSRQMPNMYIHVLVFVMQVMLRKGLGYVRACD